MEEEKKPENDRTGEKGAARQKNVKALRGG